SRGATPDLYRPVSARRALRPTSRESPGWIGIREAATDALGRSPQSRPIPRANHSSPNEHSVGYALLNERKGDVVRTAGVHSKDSEVSARSWQNRTQAGPP